MKTNLPSRVIADEVVNAVLTHYSILEAPVSRSDLAEASRAPYVVKVRAMAMYALKTALEMSYPEIGRVMERDHTSVLSAVRKVGQQYDEEEVAEVMAYVQARLDRQRRELVQRMYEEVAAS